MPKFVSAIAVAAVTWIAFSAATLAQLVPPRDDLQASSFLLANRWYDFDFVKGAAPNYGPGTEPLALPTVKIVRVINESWVEIAFPLSRKQHLGLLNARSADDRYSGRATVDGRVFVDWEKSITEWRVLWVNLQHVAGITPLE